MSTSFGSPWDQSLEDLDPLDLAVLQAFRRAAHANRQMFARLVGFEQHGRPGRALVLMVLSRGTEGISQRELAEALRVTPPTVSVMLQKMEQSGLVERRTDESDQRVTRIRITEKGRKLSDSIRERYARYIEASLGKMSTADREEFSRLLDQFADNLLDALSSDPECHA